MIVLSALRGKFAKRTRQFFASQQRVDLRYVKPRLRLLRHRERMLRDIAAPFEEASEAAHRLRYRDACFDHGADESQAYGHYFYTRLAQQFDGCHPAEKFSPPRSKGAKVTNRARREPLTPFEFPLRLGALAVRKPCRTPTRFSTEPDLLTKDNRPSNMALNR